MTNSRDIEHANAQGKGLARQSTVAKRSSAPCPVHPGMADRVSDTVGAAPTGRPADAAAPALYSTQQAGKAFPMPGITRGMKSDPERGSYDPERGERIMDQAHAKRLADSLPQAISEET